MTDMDETEHSGKSGQSGANYTPKPRFWQGPGGLFALGAAGFATAGGRGYWLRKGRTGRLDPARL